LWLVNPDCETMRATRLLIPFLLFAAPVAAQRVENYKKLEFMAGCWHAETGKDQTAEEVWSAPTETIMLGYTRYFNKGKPTNWDFNYIQKADSTVYLILGPHGEVPDTFRLKILNDEVASWSRTGTDFPGTVMYRKASNGDLIGRLEAPEGVDQTSVEVRFERAKCPGQK
jgi:Domain of unknown function (DUF6265)